MIKPRNALAIFAITALFGCTLEPPASTPTIEQVQLRLHSTPATQALTRDLAQHFSALRPELTIEVRGQSYLTLMDQVAKGSIDYFMSSFVPPQEGIWAAPMAQDGLVLLAHPQNRLANLKLDDLRDVFGGQVSSWQSLDGSHAQILPLTYPPEDDLYHEFHRLIMGRQRITGNARLVPNIAAMIRQVADSEGAIGYIPLHHAVAGVKVLAIDGVLPDAASMRDRIYPLRSTLFIIGREEPPAVWRSFFGWIQSAAGQKIVARAFTPLP